MAAPTTEGELAVYLCVCARAHVRACAHVAAPTTERESTRGGAEPAMTTAPLASGRVR